MLWLETVLFLTTVTGMLFTHGPTPRNPTEDSLDVTVALDNLVPQDKLFGDAI